MSFPSDWIEDAGSAVDLQRRPPAVGAWLAVLLLVPIVAMPVIGTKDIVVRLALGSFGGLISVASVFAAYRGRQLRERGSEFGRELASRIQQVRDLSDLDIESLSEYVANAKLTAADRLYFTRSAYVEAVSIALSGEGFTPRDGKVIQSLALALCVAPEFAAQARIESFRSLYFTYVADVHLEPGEQMMLQSVQHLLEIPDEAISRERRIIDRLAEVRRIEAGSLTPVEPSIRLQRGEVCFFEGNGRLLKSKILRSFQREGQKFHVRGLVVAKEGVLAVTNKRLLLVSDGATSIPMGKLLDVEIDLDQNLISMVKDGAANPILLTVEDALTVGAIINAVVEAR